MGLYYPWCIHAGLVFMSDNSAQSSFFVAFVCFVFTIYQFRVATWATQPLELVGGRRTMWK